jgi:hypothetical protein
LISSPHFLHFKFSLRSKLPICFLRFRSRTQRHPEDNRPFLEPFPWESESCLLDGFGLLAFRLRLRRRSLLNAVESMFCHGLNQLTIAPPQVSLPLAVQAHSGQVFALNEFSTPHALQ